MTGPVGTGSSYRLAVSAEMVFVDLPFEDRVRRIADCGFEVEIWDWTKKDIGALGKTGATFSSMTGYITGGRQVAQSRGCRRIHPSAIHAAGRGTITPATLVVFDVLALAGRDLRTRPYWARREHLEQLLRHARTPLVLTPATRELAGARAWMADHAAAGIEGVIMKDVRD